MCHQHICSENGAIWKKKRGVGGILHEEAPTISWLCHPCALFDRLSSAHGTRRRNWHKSKRPVFDRYFCLFSFLKLTPTPTPSSLKFILFVSWNKMELHNRQHFILCIHTKLIMGHSPVLHFPGCISCFQTRLLLRGLSLEELRCLSEKASVEL